MPALPPPCPIERLDVPAKGGWWRLRQMMKPRKARRRMLTRTMNDTSLTLDERSSRMRCLIDLGLWGDHFSQDDIRAATRPGRGLMGDINEIFRMLFFIPEYEMEKNSEKAMQEERYLIAIQVAMGSCLSSENSNLVHLALEAGLDTRWHENNNFDDNLLTLCARKGLVEPFKLFLRAGADPYWRDSCNETPLVLCLRGMNSGTGRTALFTEMADAMVEAGVDINSAGPPRKYSSPGGPPLKHALDKADPAGVDWLVAHNVNPGALDDEGGGLCHWLAETSGSNLAKAELKFGVRLDVDTPNELGQTPLWIAALRHNRDFADQLMARGARLDVRPYRAHRHDYFDGEQDGDPAHGKSLLQVVIEQSARSGAATKWAQDLAQKIHQHHPDCWNWETPWGKPLKQWIQEGEPNGYWTAAAQEIQHEEKTAPATGVRKKGPRL